MGRYPTRARFGVSIHAPVRERPGAPEKGARQNPVSIHAPVRERQDYECHLSGSPCRFNSRSREGATRDMPRMMDWILGFQFTLP